jgi:three-Cys-motif partner protein
MSSLPPHSEAKVRLLGLYLREYISVIGNTSYVPKIRIYDLFCGEGVYGNGGHGSPIVALKAIKEIKQSGRLSKECPPIDCHFNDILSEKVEKVRQHCAALALNADPKVSIIFTTSDYQEIVTSLIHQFAKLNREKAFVFIDPYDYKHIRAKDIKSLLQHKNSEVLLWLPTQFMYRFHKKATPEALQDFISELRLQYQDYKESDSPYLFVSELCEGFRKFMGQDYFVDTFTIQKDEQTVFCLFFFSSHIYGFEKMLKVKWDIDSEQGKGWEYNAMPTLFADFKTNPLEQKLRQFLKEPRTNGEVYAFTLHAGFLPKHTNEILDSWKNQPNFTVVSPKGEKVPKGAYYISYDNYKNAPGKVKICIK